MRHTYPAELPIARPAPAPAPSPAPAPAQPTPDQRLAALRPGTVLAALDGIHAQSDVHRRWRDAVGRLIARRTRLRALGDLREALTRPALADGPGRARLLPAARVIEEEWLNEVFIWGHLTEEIADHALSLLVDGAPRSAEGIGWTLDGPPYEGDGLFPAEQDAPLDASGYIDEPLITPQWSREVIPPLVCAALDRLADIHTAREAFDDEFLCPHSASECSADYHVPPARQAAAAALWETISGFPAAVLAYGDAVAVSLAAELRPALLVSAHLVGRPA